MKPYLLIITFICLASFKSLAQVGVDFHQSSLPFIGLTYDIQTIFLAELRLSTDVQFDNVSPELIIAYKIARTDNFNFYTGVGGRANVFTGVVVPLGVAFYPFENKQFGFQMEVAPILGENSVLRGSWGIRYRFR